MDHAKASEDPAKPTVAKTKKPRSSKNTATEGSKPTPRKRKDATTKKVAATIEANPLSESEKDLLTDLQGKITAAKEDIRLRDDKADEAAVTIADALYKIRDQKLYREHAKSFAEYSRKEFKYARSHANRMADTGRILAQANVSPHGDIIKLITSEAIARPLLSVTDTQRGEVFVILRKWLTWSKEEALTPRVVKAAVTCAFPPRAPDVSTNEDLPLLNTMRNVVRDAKKLIANDAQQATAEAFALIEDKIKELETPRSTTGLDRTDHTWNSIVGCTYVSEGCKHCYAAKLAATRYVHMHPGIAEVKTSEKKGKTYAFNGTLVLLPERLSEPLENRTPSRYFVNSLSDLFHQDLDEDFIETVFKVMEQASWHTFQVLTKRPERMAEFTQKYYADRTPPANIWLGTSTENQETFDKRLPHLLKTKAAVLWLSAEPLIGPIAMPSLEGVHWVVVGGESGSTRKMEKPWALDIRDACKSADVPFFFKQWGAYREDGTKGKETKDAASEADELEEAGNKKTSKSPATLDGVVHDEYPADR